MTPLRRLGVALLMLVGLAFSAFGVDDLRMTAPPPMHERYFARIPGGASPEVASLVLYMFDGQGGLFLGSGLAVLVLSAGPIRRGDRHALAAAFLIVLCGSAGVIWCLHQMGAGLGIPVGLLAVGLAGSVLCVARPPPGRSPVEAPPPGGLS
jgi:hypothetical protein